VVVALVLRAGRFDAAAGLKILTSAGAFGAILGYHLAVRRRRARGVRGPLDRWPRFIASPMAFGIGMIVIFGSFVISIVLLLAYNALTKGG
jgi:hypothetical protein